MPSSTEKMPAIADNTRMPAPPVSLEKLATIMKIPLKIR